MEKEEEGIMVYDELKLKLDKALTWVAFSSDVYEIYEREFKTVLEGDEPISEIFRIMELAKYFRTGTDWVKYKEV